MKTKKTLDNIHRVISQEDPEMAATLERKILSFNRQWIVDNPERMKRDKNGNEINAFEYILKNRRKYIDKLFNVKKGRKVEFYHPDPVKDNDLYSRAIRGLYNQYLIPNGRLNLFKNASNAIELEDGTKIDYFQGIEYDIIKFDYEYADRLIEGMMDCYQAEAALNKMIEETENKAKIKRR